MHNSHATSIKPTLNHSCKLLFLTTSLASILGCQSMGPHSTSDSLSSFDLNDEPLSANTQYVSFLNANNEAYNSQFATGASNDDQAKQVFISAINTHLDTDHVATTKTTMQMVPFFKENSIDADAQNALMSILDGSFSKDNISKSLMMASMGVRNSDSDLEGYSDGEEEVIAVGEGEDQEYDYDSDFEDARAAAQEAANDALISIADESSFYGDAYRTKEDYLQDPDALYLNYIDEKYGLKPSPNYMVTIKQALTDDALYNAMTVETHIDNLYQCTADYSYALDDIVENNLEISADNLETIQSLKVSYQNCLKEVNSAESSVLDNANIYQRQYIQREQGCIDRFTKNTDDYLSSDVSKDSQLEIYYNTWELFSACDWSVYLLNDLEPVNYIEYQWPQYYLEYKLDVIECSDKMIESHKQAILEGINYKNNPQYFIELADTDIEQCETAALVKKTNYEINNDLYDYDDTDYSYGEYESPDRSEVVKETFAMMKLSPAQIEANNLYVYQNVTFNRLSEYNASQRKYNSIYSYEFTGPSTYTSIQLPVGLDFNKGSMTLDPSAILPFVAIISPEHAPLPEELQETTVEFGLPEEIASKIPTDVIYDSLMSAIQYSFSELDSSNFSAIDISNDDFAKSLGARSAVKVNLDAYQSGKMLGVIMKHMANTLETHVIENEDDYNDAQLILKGLETWKTLNNKYLTDDVGRLLQLIESVVPLTFNKTNYYYLNSNGQLIGKQVNTSVGSDLVGHTSTSITQTRYDASSFENNPLKPLFIESFGQPFDNNSNVKSMDGNAWIKRISDQKEYLEKAREARAEYNLMNNDDAADTYGNASLSDCSCDISSENLDDMDFGDKSDYESAITVIDYGNVSDYSESEVYQDEEVGVDED